MDASLYSHVLCNYLTTPEERPRVYFPSYLETKISVSEAHILSSLPASFQRFSPKFGENVVR